MKPLIVCGTGTSLVCLATEDGLFLAADDLVYTEHDGQAMPLEQDYRKVGAINNILIGTAGLMIHREIGYVLNDWIAELFAELGATPNGLPSSVAVSVLQKLQNTFLPAEPLVAKGVWQGYKPGDRLVNFVVAGYTKNFKRPYIFEVGVEINRSNDGLTFIGPIHLQHALPHTVCFGEDHHYERANDRLEPEHSFRASSVDEVYPYVASDWPNIPQPLQEAVACTVAYVRCASRAIPNNSLNDFCGAKTVASFVARCYAFHAAYTHAQTHSHCRGRAFRQKCHTDVH